MIFKDHWVPTALVMEALQQCGIQALRYSLYGTKIPVNQLKENKTLLFLMDQSAPEFSFYDVAFSVYDRDIVGVFLDSIPLFLPKLKKYPYFGYLFDGSVGGFSFSVDKMFDFKCYSLLHHHLMAKSKMEWTVPKLKVHLISRRDALGGLLRHLHCSNSCMGGHHLEIRYYRKGLWDALNSFGTLCLDDLDSLNEWLNSFAIFSSSRE